MKTKVQFLKSYDLKELEDKVNDLLEKGWKINGNLISQNDTFYMVLEKES